MLFQGPLAAFHVDHLDFRAGQVDVRADDLEPLDRGRADHFGQRLFEFVRSVIAIRQQNEHNAALSGGFRILLLFCGD